MKQMVIDTILLKECSPGILWPVVVSLLASVPVHRQQEAVGALSFKLYITLTKSIHHCLTY